MRKIDFYFTPYLNSNGLAFNEFYVTANQNMSHIMRNLLMPDTNNKGADQPAHPRSLISAFVVRCLDSIISLVSMPLIFTGGHGNRKAKFSKNRKKKETFKNQEAGVLDVDNYTKP